MPTPGRSVVMKTLAALVVVLAAALHFGAVELTRIDGPIRGDARDYVAYAWNLVSHGVFSHAWPGSFAGLPPPDALRSPGYPAFLAIFFDPASPWPSLVRVLYAQAALGVFTVVVYLLLFRRFLAPGWALAAALLTAISPHLVNSSVYLLTESLFAFLLGAHLLALANAIDRRQAAWALAAGVLLAASMLVRPTTQYLIVAYGTALWLRRRDAGPGALRLFVCLLLPVVVAGTGWSVRNLVATGRTADPTLAANFIQHGMYPNMMFDDRPESYGYPYRFDPENEAIAGDPGRVLDALARRAAAEPRRTLAWFVIGKPIEFFSWDLVESVGDAFVFAPLASPYFDRPLFLATHDLAHWLHPLAMLLAAVGAALACRRGSAPVAAALAVVWIYVVLFHIVGAPFPRYSIPLRPLCYGLAAFAAQALWTRAAALIRSRP